MCVCKIEYMFVWVSMRCVFELEHKCVHIPVCVCVYAIVSIFIFVCVHIILSVFWFETAFVLLCGASICVHACAYTSFVSLPNKWCS